MDDKACFVLPLHPPKYNFALNFLHSNEKFDNHDIILVFSSEEDKNKFNYKFSNNTIPIIYNNKYTNYIITQKKFFGLKYAFDNKYSYAATIDSECLFLKNVNLYDLFKKKYSLKTIYSTFSYHDFILKIIESPKKYFINKNNLPKNDYFWFNDIPIYEKNDFIDFFNNLNIFEDEFNNKLKNLDFDYIIYAYYLLLNKNWKLINLNKEINVSLVESFVESMNSLDINLINKYYDITDSYWSKKTDLYKNIFIQIHLDRQ